RDILGVFSQRWNEERNDVEPVEQVLAKVAALDFLVQMLVGGGDNPHVHGQVAPRAERRKALLLDHAQDLGLGAQAHIADFIEEERSAAGLLEFSRFVFERARKRPLHVPEELAFDQLLGNRGAVELHKRLLGPRAHPVQGRSDQLFPGAALAVHQDAAVGGSRERELLPQRLHRHAVTDHAAPSLQFLAQEPVLGAEFDLMERVAKRQQCLIDGEWFLDEVKSPELGGAHRSFDGGVAGDHDDHRRVLERLDPFELLKAIHRGQPDIKQYNVAAVLAEELETLFAALNRLRAVALVLKDAGERLANPRFVVDDEDGVLHTRMNYE